MRARRIVKSIAVVAVGVLLAGCSRSMLGVVGLQRFDGHLYAVVQMCDGHTVDDLWMFEQGGALRDEWSFPHAVGSGVLGLGVFADSVSLLDTGNHFAMGANASGFGSDFANGPDFTSEDLAGLAEGEILAHNAGADWQLRNWTPDSFAFMADRYCEPFER